MASAASLDLAVAVGEVAPRGDDPVPPGAEAVTSLPVRWALAGKRSQEIRQWLESMCGWQDVDEAAERVPPAIIVADSSGAPAEVAEGTPVVLVVESGEDPTAAAAAAIASRAATVVSWPEDRDRLPAIGGQLAGSRPVAEVATRDVVIGAASGGVGLTTVTLALGGLAAWRGMRALVVTHGYVPAPTGGLREPDDLASNGLWKAAAPARGVPGLRVIRLQGPSGSSPVGADVADVTLRDAGVAPDVDVLVCRRDRAGVDAVAATTASVVVVADTGLVPLTALVAAAEGRRLVLVPWSARVARAALSERVPAGLPGSWLRSLAPATPTSTEAT